MGSQRRATKLSTRQIPSSTAIVEFGGVECTSNVQRMKTLLNDRDRNEVLYRLSRVRSDSQRRWGNMSAHQMICHLSDSFRAALGEKQISSSSTLFKRTIHKWAALWMPLQWPHGIKTRPGGWKGEFAPHAMLGQLSRTERMRHAYLRMDHHLRQFGA
jgi:hypothetical protein